MVFLLTDTGTGAHKECLAEVAEKEYKFGRKYQKVIYRDTTTDVCSGSITNKKSATQTGIALRLGRVSGTVST